MRVLSGGEAGQRLNGKICGESEVSPHLLGSYLLFVLMFQYAEDVTGVVSWDMGEDGAAYSVSKVALS